MLVDVSNSCVEYIVWQACQSNDVGQNNDVLKGMFSKLATKNQQIVRNKE